MSLTLLHGDNAILLQEALEKLKAQTWGDPSLAALNTTELEGNTVTLAALQPLCATGGFLGKRLVIINGLGKRVGPQQRPEMSGQRRAVEQAPQPPAEQQGREDFLARPLAAALSAHQEQVARQLKALGEQAELVFVDDERLSPQNPLRRAVAAAGGKTLFFAAPNAERLHSWIELRVRQREGRISREAAQLLAAFSGQDLLALDQEIAKLVAYAGQEVIDETTVRSMVTSSRQAVIFSLVDALGLGDWAAALRLAHQLVQEGANPAYLFAMILRQFRILVQIKDWESRGVAAEQIAAAINLHPYVVQKALPQAARFSEEQLAAIYHRLLAMDSGVKSGTIGIEVALDLLIARSGRVSSYGEGSSVW